MPTGMFEYRDDGERRAIERAIAFVAEMRDLAQTAPDEQVLGLCEAQAVERGRDRLRATLQEAVQTRVEAAVMLVQGAVGLLGFYFHIAANLHGPAPRLWDNFLFGAPALAPLLFPNLVLLACIGLWVLGEQLPAKEANSPAITDRQSY
jgi:hypothetical protein